MLGALRHSVHPAPRRALNQILAAEDRSHAERAIQAFAAEFGVKWPKAVAKVTDEAETLLCFFDFPAEHWLHLRTTNPIESSFSPVRARTRVTKGPGTKDTGLAMVFKLLQAAEGRWRAVNGPHLVALVRAGARFEKGKLIERPDPTPDKEAGEDVTKGPGSKAAGLAIAFKLLEAAQDRWRAVNGPHLVALVRAGARFEPGDQQVHPSLEVLGMHRTAVFHRYPTGRITIAGQI